MYAIIEESYLSSKVFAVKNLYFFLALLMAITITTGLQD